MTFAKNNYLLSQSVKKCITEKSYDELIHLSLNTTLSKELSITPDALAILLTPSKQMVANRISGHNGIYLLPEYKVGSEIVFMFLDK